MALSKSLHSFQIYCRAESNAGLWSEIDYHSDTFWLVADAGGSNALAVGFKYRY